VQKLRAAHPTEVLVEEDAYRAALAAETRRKQRAAQVLFDAPEGEPEMELFDARSP
jgi:hypothetical protein